MNGQQKFTEDYLDVFEILCSDDFCDTMAALNVKQLSFYGNLTGKTHYT